MASHRIASHRMAWHGMATQAKAYRYDPYSKVLTAEDPYLII